MEPRYYQEEAYHCCLNSLERVRATLLVMATGLGKSATFAMVAKDWPGNVLITAHRDELVSQAVDTLEKVTGEVVGVEKADSVSAPYHRIVVASVQSLNPKRLERLGTHRFSLVVADEGHRYAARTYKRALDYFNAKVLGVTATPDRGDGKALGIVFDETAFVFDIMDGIDAGYLVPLQYQSVRIDSIDISGVKSSGGDLSEAGLDDAILKGTEGIVQESLRLGGTRQAIAFWPGTRSAKFACDRYNAIVPGVARYIDANTPQRERRDTVARFKAGEFRILCNVGIATEGFDAPATSCIILARPTKSRQLATQMVGRGTRVLPGVVDTFRRATEARKRRDAIAKSDKPDCLVLDFVGNAGRHQLITPVDILGGKYTTPELELARKEVLELQSEDRPADVAQSLKLAREALARVAEQISSKVESTVTSVDPFSVLHLKQTSKYTERFGHKPASSAQKESLRKAGLPETHLAAMKASDAAQILNAMAVRRSKGLASYRQLRMLRKHGFSDINITYVSASRAIDYIASTGYGERAKVEREKIVEAMKGNVVI